MHHQTLRKLAFPPPLAAVRCGACFGNGLVANLSTSFSCHEELVLAMAWLPMTSRQFSLSRSEILVQKPKIRIFRSHKIFARALYLFLLPGSV
jgi:hypothetical protein